MLAQALDREALLVEARELAELRRQPLLILSLVGGPMLVLLAFGASYRNTNPVLRTAIVLPIVALTPLMIIPFSWHLEGERPTVRSLLGGVVAVAGVIGLTLARVK